MSTDIIGCFYGRAGKIAGAEVGATILRNKMLCEHPEVFSKEIFLSKESNGVGIERLDEVLEICGKLQKEVYDSLINEAKVFVIGGDHSISLGSITGAIKAATVANANLGVIYFDAHGDMNTLESSETGNIHGMGVAAAMNIGDKRMVAITDDYLNSQNLLLIGTRSLDIFERDLVRRKNIKCISAEDCNTKDILLVAKEIESFIANNKIDRLHISVDIDVVDPKEAPGTGVPEDKGITGQYLKRLLRYVLSSDKVFSADFVEYNPKLDTDDKTLQLSAEVCDIIMDGI